MSALPNVVDFGAWVRSLLDLRRSDLEHKGAASNIVLAYARALARAQGMPEAFAITTAFEALRHDMGEERAVQALESVGFDPWAALDEVEEEQRAESEEARRDVMLPWGEELS